MADHVCVPAICNTPSAAALNAAGPSISSQEKQERCKQEEDLTLCVWEFDSKLKLRRLWLLAGGLHCGTGGVQDAGRDGLSIVDLIRKWREACAVQR